MQQGPTQRTTYLSYAVFVRPQRWLPVRLIQHRIQGKIEANLCAVQQHTESLWRSERKQVSQASQASQSSGSESEASES